MRTAVIFALLTIGTFALAQTNERAAWNAPAEASGKQNPLKDKPELAAGGKKVFSKMCVVCHAAGANQKGPHLESPLVQEQSDGAVFWKLTNGNSRTGMPSFSSLPEAQRWQLVMYIRTMKP